ncbi:PEP-CTERM protein-sorting domain-containing protein [Terrimicrobium sacchariphilum]|uniref:PEP-CTERM protein-sorting domain-containing protein n=1 Tax=Terrimicrobium sacchariphilum TaxID=690879 RepID=A0A146G2Z5_TERSA|nr:PEP-CTERM sorting domain-containing protein [Terrimicrobium sacchariphilum]GAT31454.1 PEP-CTERM protein-sorting domain-containing protein [Terrimicrobium sacchariphilum]
MKLRIHAAAVIALAITAASSLTAKAATVTDYQNGDIFLGIRALSSDTGQGNSTVYLLNLGNFSEFTNATAGASIQVANLLSDLSAIYGADWYRSSLQWGIFGGLTDTGTDSWASLYASRTVSTSTPWSALSGNPAETTLSNVNKVRNSFNGSLAYGSNLDATTQTTTGEYYKQVTAVGNDFGSGSKWTSIETSLTNQLNLFAINNGDSTVDKVGTFGVSNQGVLTFTAVPEPSTYLLIGLAGTAALIFRRRLTKQNA